MTHDRVIRIGSESERRKRQLGGLGIKRIPGHFVMITVWNRFCISLKMAKVIAMSLAGPLLSK